MALSNHNNSALIYMLLAAQKRHQTVHFYRCNILMEMPYIRFPLMRTRNIFEQTVDESPALITICWLLVLM